MASNEREKAESQSADAKRQAAERAYALGFEYEQKYENCAQCLLAAVHELVGGVDEALFKASHNLAGGGGLTTKGTCGALSGGMLAFGSRYGRERELHQGDRHSEIREVQRAPREVRWRVR